MTNPVLSREAVTPSEAAAERKRARLNAFGAWWKRRGFKYLVVANVAVMLMSATHIVHGLMREHTVQPAPGQILDAQGATIDIQGGVTIDGLKPRVDHQFVILRVRGDAACSSTITASSASVSPDERITTSGDKSIVLPIGSSVTLWHDGEYGWRVVATASSTIPLLTPTSIPDGDLSAPSCEVTGANGYGMITLRSQHCGVALPGGGETAPTCSLVGRESGPTYSWTTERANGVWHLMLTATTWPTTIDYACRSADVIRWNGEASVTLANPINGGTLTDDCHAMQARGLTIACGSSNHILWTGSSIPSSSITGITGATP